MSAATEIDLRPDLDAAIDFLVHLRPGGPWQLGSIAEGEKRLRLVTFVDLDLMAALIRRAQERAANIYYLLNPARAGVKTTPKKEEVEKLAGLHADVDLILGMLATTANIDVLIEKAMAMEPPPTYAVMTGGGVQPVWLFDAALPASDQVKVETTNEAIARHLGADKCHNVNRWLRLPGTINFPDATKRARGRVPVLAYLISADWSRTWSYARDAVPHLPFDPTPTPTPTPIPLPDDLGSLPVGIIKRIKKPNYADYGGDRSRAVFSVSCTLVRRGWTDEAIAAVLLDPNNGISEHVRDQSNPAEYAQRQAQKARKEIGADWVRTEKGGIDPRSRRNVDRAVAAMEVRLRYDEFALRLSAEEPGRGVRFLDDAAVNHLRFAIDERFGWRPDERFFFQYAEEIARERGAFHPVHEYLDGLVWDGEERLDYWLTTYLGVEHNELTRAIGRLWLVGAVRRIRQPGCKFDQMLVLMGEKQGTGKSTVLLVLAVKPEWFTDSVSFTTSGKEMIEQLQGKWIVEFPELKGMRDNRIDKIKAQLSRQVDRGRPAYGRLPIEAPRQCILSGTCNSLEPLVDRTGNRRFWCVAVGEIKIEELRRDVDQLWAEASAAEREIVGDIRLDPSLWPKAEQLAEEHTQSDAWADLLDDELGDIKGKIAPNDVWIILRVPEERRHDQKLVERRGEALREVGFERKQARINGKVRWAYLRGDESERQRQIDVTIDPVTNKVTVMLRPASADKTPF
jgi:hypothetical protein